MDIKKNKKFGVMLGCAVLAMLVLLLTWWMVTKGAQTKMMECRAVIAKYDAIVKRHQGEPGAALTALYRQKLQEARDAATAMRTAVVEDSSPTFKPSGFKDLVRKTVDEVVPSFKAKNVPVPEDLGFASIYTGRELPSDAEMPRLISQYLIIRDVAAELLAHPVIKVEMIDRNPGETVTDTPTEPEPSSERARTTEEQQKPVFEPVPVLFKFVTTPDTLYNLIAGIRNKSHFYRVRMLKTTMEPTAKGEGKDPSDIREDMVVEMTVEKIVLFKDDQKADGRDARKQN